MRHRHQRCTAITESADGSRPGGSRTRWAGRQFNTNIAEANSRFNDSQKALMPHKELKANPIMRKLNGAGEGEALWAAAYLMSAARRGLIQCLLYT